MQTYETMSLEIGESPLNIYMLLATAIINHRGG